ncbi:MAG: 4Fe-4S binding protein [Methanobrevibacter sp.]|nr:4Fe-4S binding protein [Methanobrevibacter sp.]
MKRMSKVTTIFFSPSGTTKKVVNQIANNFEGETVICDLLYFNGEKEFSREDIVIVGMPVFAGRIPKTARDRLSKLTGDDTKAIAVVNYGNAHVTDALIELVDLLKESNFDVVAAASTISHHSIFDGVAVGRPDEADIEKINEFSQNAIERIENGSSIEAEVPGNRPYVDYKQLPFVVSCDDSKCVFCLECVSVCPERAIPDDDPADVDLDLCSRCTSCINICPENARGFTGEAFEAKKPAFESANAERKEPEFYY